MSKTALVILAPGAEASEFVIIVDILRRAEISTTAAGLDGVEPIKCSTGVVIIPDAALEDFKDRTFDAVVLPGGFEGSDILSKSELAGTILKKQATEGRLIAAICAGPTVLAAHDIFPGKTLTSYPLVKQKLTTNYNYVEDRNVVEDGNLITSRCPGTTFEFALKVAEVLVGEKKAKAVERGMLLTKT